VSPLIVESIVTTMDAGGTVNVAPMGVEWWEGGEGEGEGTGNERGTRIVLKPFLDTTTFRNVRATGAAVVNLTDDVLLFARAAISSPQYPTRPASVVRGVVLEAACSWRELRVRSLDPTPPRARIEADVVHRGTAREFIGFNRARNAVLEAAILSTRLHLIPRAEVDRELARLQVIVDKTAGPRELEAMQVLTDYVRRSGPPGT